MQADMQITDRPKEAAAQQGDQDLGVAGCIPFQGSSASCAAHADHGPCRLAPAHAVKFRWYAPPNWQGLNLRKPWSQPSIDLHVYRAAAHAATCGNLQHS